MNTFKRKEVTEMLGPAGVNDERLMKWHTQHVAPGGPVGRGNAREYTERDVFYLAAFAYLAERPQ